mgnify:CR=1 FL=1
MSRLKNPLLLLVLLSLVACTPLRREGGEPLSPEEIRLRAIESKQQDLIRRLNMLENKDDSKIEDDLRNLRGETERLRFDRDTSDRKNRDQMQDFDRRLQKLESQPLPNAVAATAPVAPADTYVVPPPAVPAQTAPATPVAGSGSDEQKAYLKAFDFLKAGQYDSAITGFRAMLAQYPQGNFADNGWYWLGESLYVKRQYKPALDAYDALLQKFPTSPKVPDALFKIGLVQSELKQADLAKAAWRRVVKDFPNSNAAGLARQRLAQTP